MVFLYLDARIAINREVIADESKFICYTIREFSRKQEKIAYLSIS